LACRSPPRLSRWRLVFPLEAGIGETPHKAAKGGFGAEPAGVVAAGDKQLGGGLGAGTADGGQPGPGDADEHGQLALQGVGFGGKGPAAAGQAAQGGPGSVLRGGWIAGGPQPRARSDQGRRGGDGELLAEPGGCGNQQAPELVDGCGAGLDCPGPGDVQGADGLHDPVAHLGDGAGAA
jgi:hypothetical protein